MSNFEVIVRPAVVPNFRPATPRVLAPEDNPEQGLVTLGGSPSQDIKLTSSYSLTVSKAGSTEMQRTYDVDQIYQMDDDGNINRDNYVRAERLKKMKLKDDKGQTYMWDFALPPELDNVDTILTDQVRTNVAEAISGEG